MKIRQNQRGWRALRGLHLTGWIITLLIPCGAWWMERSSLNGVQEIRREMRAEGLPLTPIELNKPLPPVKQNAAPVYRQLTQLLAAKPLAGKEAVLNEIDKNVPLPPQRLAQIRRRLQTRQDVLQLVHQAAMRPQCVFNRDYSSGMDTLFPEYAQMRTDLRVLTNESLVLLADGKPLDAIHNAALGFHMAQHGASDDTLIGKLMGVALNAITLRFMERALYVAGDQPGVAQAVADTIAQNWHSVSMADGMRGEVVLGEVMFADMRAGRIKPAPEKSEETFVKAEGRKPHLIARALQAANERNLLRYQQQTIRWMRHSYKEGKSGLAQVEKEAEGSRYLPTRAIAAILVPVFSQARAKQAQGEAQAANVRAAARVLAYRQRHGAFPDTLTQALSSLPNGAYEDPFSGQPLRYRRQGSGFAVYSLGPTGQFDGGTPDRKPAGRETVFTFPMPPYFTRK